MELDYRPIVGNILLFFLILGMSVSVNISHFRKQITNVRAILTGLFLQFIVLPALGYATIKIANFDFVWGVMLLIITASPGGAYSNLYCSLFNADMALSVTMTAVSTILSIGFLPLNIYAYSTLAYNNDPVLDTLDWTALGVTIVVVILAVSVGITLTYKVGSKPVGKKIRVVSNAFGNFCGISLVLFTSLFPEGGRIILAGREPTFYYTPMMPMLFGLLFSNILSSLMKLKYPERVTVSVECVYQNTSIAMTSCLALFQGEDQSRGLAIALWYTGMQGAIILVYCFIAWKFEWTMAPSDEKFFKMLLKNYQDFNKDDTNSESSAEDNRDDSSNSNNDNKIWNGNPPVKLTVK